MRRLFRKIFEAVPDIAENMVGSALFIVRTPLPDEKEDKKHYIIK